MSTTTKGCGFLNHAINALPFELHIFEYQFCGPGMHLEKRLIRGDRDINQLDSAYREHDIAYSRNKDLAKRHVADKILAKKTRKRIIATDSRAASLGERAAATVWAAMKAKTKIGMGKQRRNQRKSKYFW